MNQHGEFLQAGTLARVAQQRMPLNVLFGVPDDGRGIVRVASDGRTLIAEATGPRHRSFTLRGSANIAPYLSPERFAVDQFYVQDDAELVGRLGPGPLLNHIADPDICSRALALVATFADQGQRPCFNHPTAVARTSRDGVARLLDGIPGLTVPRTIRVEQRHPAFVREAAKDSGLRYPILVRVVGSHGGDDRLRIERPEAMDEITQLKHRDSPLYLTEFCEFVSPDGHYRKFRVTAIGDDIFLRQCVIGGDWSLHGRSRVADTEHEETAVFESFDSEWAPVVKPVFSEMARRIGLDYFGVDCHIDSKRNVLLFEANACMKVLKNYRPPPNRFVAPIARIKNALEDRLALPETWRYARGGG
jgi:glutathione synthase/RimK-type ligase-like ATP-grasp enzyme